MEFSIRALAPEKAKTGCLVLAVFAAPSGAQPALGAPVLMRTTQLADQAAAGALRRVLAQGDLARKAGATLLLQKIPGLAAERVLLVSLGEHDDFNVTAFREAVRGAATALKSLGARDAVLPVADFAVSSRGLPWTVRHAILGIREVFYRFDQLQTQKKPAAPVLAALTLAITGAPVTLRLQAEKKVLREGQLALREAVATADGVDLARTLGNLPPNLCTPSYLADQAKKLAKQFKLGIEVLERRDMEKLGMGALLAVTRGSHQPPKLIVLHYSGAGEKKKPLVLVGKGITFDTGGISLKPGGEMDEMKFDMSGAGSVLGVIHALAGMRAPVNVIGVIPACENMPGGAATRPGDVVTTLSGQTVEILNTDAEGRLILCDALTYAERFNPQAMVDIATLTGACVIALGHVATGLFANDQKLADEILAAGDDAWDRVWQMPLWEDYQEQLRSNFADMANIGGRPAGSVTAACYLARFTRKQKWAHLDIAGTAWRSGKDKGSTGRPVPLLVRLALRRAGSRA
ncbi:MAG: leucyl aminopeptidase [Betaproteobacteria bacterium]|nr:leucyl aminopeptidase [Betaproteobacteria bacterium]MSQ87728.1 leucyl aminopeptidase [Betaproteobacteria bacterium]